MDKIKEVEPTDNHVIRKTRLHYFSKEKAPSTDIELWMAKNQGYVPQNCLLAGPVVMGLVAEGSSPCDGCNGPREKCGGRAKDTYRGKS